jgi:hypothetical protein
LDFQPLGTKARALAVDFSDTLDINLNAKAHQKMTQRPIVAYLSLKEMWAREIHDDVVATLGPDAVTCSSVTGYLGEARCPPSKP